eukprot:295611-Amphidinium_carterae.1
MAVAALISVLTHHQAAERWKLGATAIVQAAERVATQRGQETPTAEEATAVAQPENRPFWEVTAVENCAPPRSKVYPRTREKPPKPSSK